MFYRNSSFKSAFSRAQHSKRNSTFGHRISIFKFDKRLSDGVHQEAVLSPDRNQYDRRYLIFQIGSKLITM
jgi:hypothetical protein